MANEGCDEAAVRGRGREVRTYEGRPVVLRDDGVRGGKT